jgi:large subunit ribosomal protein L17
MPGNRKLNRPTDQRVAVIRGLCTALISNGRIETTEARAKEVKKIAEKLITLAIRDYAGNVEVTKETLNEKKQSVKQTFTNDTPAKLSTRRQLMAYLYDVPEKQKKDESLSVYKLRTKDVEHPVVEILFREIAPKYAKRKEEKGQGGGYTRIVKKGPRRGDAAEMVILELI